MEPTKLLTGYYWASLFIVFLICLFFTIAQYGKEALKEEQEYDDLYRTISNMIDGDVTKESYDRILLKIKQIRELKWTNKEKTDVLSSRFFTKFGKVRIEKHLNGNVA